MIKRKHKTFIPVKTARPTSQNVQHSSPFQSPRHSSTNAQSPRLSSVVLKRARLDPDKWPYRILEPVLRNKFATFLAGALLVMVGCPSLIAIAIHGPAKTSPDTWIRTADANTMIRVYEVDTGLVRTMPLNAYISSVLAAEFDPGAPAAALEAAAVAARTYAIHAMKSTDYQRPTYAHAHNADVTNASTLDLPTLTPAEENQKFGRQASLVLAHIEDAVSTTDGQVLTYNGKPILAFMSQLSGGKSRDARTIYQQNLPYLPAVNCPDDKTAKNLHQTIYLSTAAVGKALGIDVTQGGGPPGGGSSGGNSSRSGSSSGGPETPFTVAARDASGYVRTVTYGDHTWTGDTFAQKLDLPSSNFTFVRGADPQKPIGIVTAGIGSGYGMSLHEATALAAQGKSDEEILATFYPQTTLEKDRMDYAQG